MLVGGSDLDLDNVSVARTTIPHAGGMGFRSLAPTERESATPVRRPGAVIVTHDGLGFAVTECDEVGGHRGFPSIVAGSQSGTRSHAAGALLIIHFWSLRSATKQGSKRALLSGTPRMLRRPHKCHGLGRDLSNKRTDSETLSTVAAVESAGVPTARTGEAAPQGLDAWRQRIAVILDRLVNNLRSARLLVGKMELHPTELGAGRPRSAT